MPLVQKVRMKSEKRFKRDNDPVFDMICKCVFSVYGAPVSETLIEEDSFLENGSGANVPEDGHAVALDYLCLS